MSRSPSRRVFQKLRRRMSIVKSRAEETMKRSVPATSMGSILVGCSRSTIASGCIGLGGKAPNCQGGGRQKIFHRWFSLKRREYAQIVFPALLRPNGWRFSGGGGGGTARRWRATDPRRRMPRARGWRGPGGWG